MDEVGLAVARHAGETVGSAVGADTRRNAVALLVDAGLTGKRGGAGFYRYDGKTREPNARVYELLQVTPRATPPDVAERLTALFVNEAARCLDEGVLRSPAEGDLGAVLGLGFPPFLGGPFRYADAQGTPLRERLAAWSREHGARYAPAKSLMTGEPYHR
jgi:3-hydroxyacyl-CoA dehydrogenase/enoyl-CoA hydratase/3-hydroxybutyryl-CoA epimerase